MAHPATPARRRLSAPERREQLLGIGTELAVSQGFHALSVEAVAREAGVTRAVIYQHFRDLRALLEAIVDRETTRAQAQVSETALGDLSEGDPQELLLESLNAYLHAVRDHPTTWRLVLMPPEGAPEMLRQRIEEGRRSVLAGMARAVRPALQAEEANDAEITARVLSAISDEYARLILVDPDRYPPQRLLRHARWWLSQPSFGL